METYVLRVYRRIRTSEEQLETMYGTLEQVGANVVCSFSSARELWALMQTSVYGRCGDSSGIAENDS